MELLSIALLGLAAYLIGSVSPSYTLVHYLKGIDIRDVGSHNAGTLNSYHQLGAWWAVLVFMVDAGKAALATLLPTWVGLPEWSVLVTAPLVIVGHNWTVLLKVSRGEGRGLPDRDLPGAGSGIDDDRNRARRYSAVPVKERHCGAGGRICRGQCA